jgi:hypothetical protein
MFSIHCRQFFVLTLLLESGFLLFCAKHEAKTEAIVMARVGDKSITLEEFIQRAEYTIRPRYCNGNSGLEKKIVLNSLLAEKMLALEAGQQNKLAKSDHFKRFVLGRQEQAMRQVLAHEESFAKALVDSSEVSKVYRIAGRKYDVQFYIINNDSFAIVAGKILAASTDSAFEKIFHSFCDLDTIPRREVEWSAGENEIVHQALFSEPLCVGQVIGPLHLDKDSYLIMKVKGWIDRVAITDQDIRRRWDDVTTKITEQRANAIYSNFISRIMRGKRMVFNADTFVKFVNIIGPVYFLDKKAYDDAFLDSAFDQSQEIMLADTLGKTLKAIGHNPLFQVDGKIWRVNDFLHEYERHPLVFRKKKMGKGEFAEQLKLAIADMIRDHYLTQEGYKRSYDKLELVKRYAAMWQDASIALYQESLYLKKLKMEDTDTINVVTQYLDPYVHSLQKKYSDKTEVNVDAFNDIKLTQIDMFAMQKNVPFPVYVPAFPQVTIDSKLDYGQKMPERRQRIKL